MARNLVSTKAVHPNNPGALPLCAGCKDRGATALGLIIGVCFLVIAMLFLFVLPLLRGADQASRNQNAADAAAIAAAKDIRAQVLDRLGTGDITVLTGLNGAAGGSAAQLYATRNDATLIKYSYNSWSDRVEVRVRFNKPPADGVAPGERDAVARLGVPLGRCSLSTDEVEAEPEPTPSKPDDEEEEPTPPPPPPPPEYEHSLSCPGGPTLTGFKTQSQLAIAARAHLSGMLKERLIG